MCVRLLRYLNMTAKKPPKTGKHHEKPGHYQRAGCSPWLITVLRLYLGLRPAKTPDSTPDGCLPRILARIPRVRRAVL